MWLKCCWIFFKDFKRLKSRLLMIYVAIYVAIARWLLFRAAMVGVARAVSCRQSSRAHSRRWVRTTDAPTLKKNFEHSNFQKSNSCLSIICHRKWFSVFCASLSELAFYRSGADFHNRVFASECFFTYFDQTLSRNCPLPGYTINVSFR